MEGNSDDVIELPKAGALFLLSESSYSDQTGHDDIEDENNSTGYVLEVSREKIRLFGKAQYRN